MGQGCACGLGGFLVPQGTTTPQIRPHPGLMTFATWRFGFTARTAVSTGFSSILTALSQAAQSIPNASAKAARPSSVTVTARPRGTRFTQSAERNGRGRRDRVRPTGGDVVPSSPRNTAPAAFARRQFDADVDEKRLPRIGQLVVDFMPWAAQRVVTVADRVETSVTADEHLAVQQAAHDLHAEPASEMVVTRTRGA